VIWRAPSRIAEAVRAADIVLRRLGQFNVGMLPVVDRRAITRVLGSVRLEDLLDAYRRASA